MRPLNGVLVLLLLTASPRSAQVLTIANATVVDVSNGALHPGTTVVVDANRIVSVGPAAATDARGQVVDAKGLYLIPGLWDMHTHAYFGWSSEFGDSYVLPLFIANGITGVRQMWGMEVHQQWRRRIEEGSLLGPREFIASPIIDGPKPVWPRSIAVPTRWLQVDSGHPPRRTVRRPSSPHTPIARACGPGRHVERCRRHSVLREPADWLPPPMARSPLIVLVLRAGLPSCHRSRCNTARHHRSRLCKGSAHWFGTGLREMGVNARHSAISLLPPGRFRGRGCAAPWRADSRRRSQPASCDGRGHPWRSPRAR